jgi:hypothetical protein
MREYRAQAALEGLNLGPYLDRVIALVGIVQREAQKSGATATAARSWLTTAGFRQDA